MIRKILFCVLLSLCIYGCTEKQFQTEPTIPAVTVEPMPTSAPTSPVVEVPLPKLPSKEIQWTEFSKDVVDDIMNNQKCSLVFVRDKNCPECDLMENVTLSDTDIVDFINARFVSIRVDEPDAELKEILHVEELPSLLLVPSLQESFILIIQGPISRMEMMMHLQREEFSICNN